MDAPEHAPPTKGAVDANKAPAGGYGDVMEFNNKLDVEYNLPITSNRNAKWWVALLQAHPNFCPVCMAYGFVRHYPAAVFV